MTEEHNSVSAFILQEKNETSLSKSKVFVAPVEEEPRERWL